MNISEIARRLKVTPQELKEKLPDLGFHIGRRAIQIPDSQVQKILAKWKEFKDEEERMKSLEQTRQNQLESAIQAQEPKKIFLPESIQVVRLAEKLGTSLPKLMAELMKNGIFTNLNEDLDYDVAAIIAENFGFKVQKQKSEETADLKARDRIKERIDSSENTSEKDQIKRPPIVVVCGHVDHGKTSLLDKIRTTKIAAGESGGITQKIGAYQIEKNGRLITFVDTPGHEAFKAMRERGSSIADLGILVISADDQVQPQTLESIRILTKENIPFIVAINKIDKPEANIEKVKKQLAEINLIPEDWGGKVICVPVSAKTGSGIDQLLENLLLLADLDEKKLMIPKRAKAVGIIVESHLDVGLGPVATIILMSGFLEKGDSIISARSYGKLREIKDELGKSIENVQIGQPAQIFGLKKIPFAGDLIEKIDDPKEFKAKTKLIENAVIKRKIKKGDKKEMKLKIILRTDSGGSLEAIIKSLEKIQNDKARIEIVAKGVSQPTPNDILLAQKIEAWVVGFNVSFPKETEDLAKELAVSFNRYDVIYHLLEEAQNKINRMAEPDFIEEQIGKLKILAVFNHNKNGFVLGGRVIEGEVRLGLKARVLREEQVAGGGEIKNLQSNRQNVNKIQNGSECGAQFSTPDEIKVGDILEFYEKKSTH